jgi:hypothetical protein
MTESPYPLLTPVCRRVRIEERALISPFHVIYLARMSGRIAQKIALFSFLVLLVSCGDQPLFMSVKNDTSDIQIHSITDGQVLGENDKIPLKVVAADTSKSRDLEIEVTLTSSTGTGVWHNRTAVATLNEDLPISLPNLEPGLYKLDLVLYSAGEIVQKKSSSFFVAADGWKILGIKSFPPVITATASVMLKADLQYPADANPYLRWTWKGKTIAKGTLAQGFGQILWVAPSSEGVYTILLELFPSAPPAGIDFSFTSSLFLSTDIFVSAGATGKADVGSPASYLSLLPLQAKLTDLGTGAKGKGSAGAIGAPEIVSVENGFGYRLNGSSGISIPWLTVPVDGGKLKPFTVSMGITIEDVANARNIFKASTDDGSFSLAIAMDPTTRALTASLAAGSAPALSIPWKGPNLVQGQRYLISLTVVPAGGNVTTQWFLDGTQVTQQTSAYSPPALQQDGTTVIGGDKGFTGVVDEFGVYVVDSQGRPAPDPDQFSREEALKLGSSLVLADGFDGIYLSSGFSLEGGGALAAGFITLPAGSDLGLPLIKTGGSSISITARLSPESSRGAVLEAQWEGDSQAPFQCALTADAAALKLKISEDGSSLIVPAGTTEKTLALPKPPQAGARLRLRLDGPSDAKVPLVIADLLAERDQ